MNQYGIQSIGEHYSNNYERQSRKKLLEQDIKFRKEMNETISNLERMPGYKNQIWNKITDMHNRFEEQKGQDGLRAGEIAR